MPELITIPIAIVEIAIEYANPSMKLLVDRAKVVDQLFRAFKPWDIKIDDVEVLQEGKPSEQGVKFKLPLQRTSFFFGAAVCKLVRDNAAWDTVEETIEILNAGWKTLVEIGAVEPGTFKTSIAMHLQPKALPFIELLRPFAPAPLVTLDSMPIKAIAAVLKWEKRRVTIDGSAQLANGIFLRLEREFEGTTTFVEVAKQLKKDEDQTFTLIGVEEELS
ncbi:MAG TPA: hypothetical protein VFE22_03615 [Edaphobacter sp.]|jgi:hypothetical protein|nr:hypothetical protein [Edaphobacter sp.]